MADSIDFAKVDAAFKHLADTKDGNAALDQLGKALDNVTSSIEPKLSPSEAHYLLVNLVQQRRAAFGPGLIGSAVTECAPDVKVKSDFIIKTAVT